MQVSHKIDQLIESLNRLKPKLSNNQELNSQKFSEVLQKSLEYSSEEKPAVLETKMNTSVPYWVSSSAGYDPANPRKPNMREFIEAHSGKSVEKIYAESKEKYLDICSQASEILYGVVGSRDDTRNWSRIMESEDILTAARAETGKMYDPKINLQFRTDDNNEVINQIAVVTDRNGTFLQQIPGKAAKAEETLSNFGVTSSSIPNDFIAKIDTTKFDKNLLTFLENFKEKPLENEEVATQNSSEQLTLIDLNEIPEFEQNKL